MAKLWESFSRIIGTMAVIAAITVGSIIVLWCLGHLAIWIIEKRKIKTKNKF